MIRRFTRPVRRAFTLVELMVAMGLSVLIMYIMAECSKICLDAVSLARSSGQMSTQLQGAGAILTRDLIYSDHFGRDDTRPGGGVKLSQMRLDWLPGTGTQTYTPPREGFFRIISPELQPADVALPIQDANGFTIGTAVNHALHFTSILPPGDQNLYSVTVPANGSTIFRSRAAEIAYFLVDSGTTTSPGSTVRLFKLMRTQRLVARTTDEISSLQGARSLDPAFYTDVIAAPTPNPSGRVFTLADMTDPGPGTITPPNPARRFQLPPNGLPAPVGSTLAFGVGHPRFGEDLLLSNVLSFEVKVDWSPSSVLSSSAPARTQTSVPQNWDHPFDNLSVNGGRNTTAGINGQGVFDTWSTTYNSAPNNNWNPAVAPGPNRAPLAIRVKQIQVTIRIFDPKTKLARQNTWKFSM